MSPNSENRPTPAETDKKVTVLVGRHASRFAAVQALYQLDLDPEQKIETVLMQFVQHRIRENMDGFALKSMDKAFFGELVRGVLKTREDINHMLSAVLPDDWSVARLDSVLRVLLQSGVFELSEKMDVPPRVVLDQYVEISKGFFDGKEPGLANGVLHKVASQLRPEDLAH